MNEVLKLLISYQEIDKSLKDVEDEIVKSDEAVKYMQARKFLQTVKDSIQTINTKAEALLEKYNLIVKDLSKVKETIEEYSKLAENSKTEEEILSIKKKFDDAFNLVNNKESELEAIKKEMEEVDKEFKKLYAQNKKMKEQYEENGPLYQQKKAEKSEEIKALKEKLDNLRGKIPSDIMDKYDLRRQDKKFPILYKLASNSGSYCPRCMTGLSALTMNSLNNGEIKECDTCRALIYVE